VRTPLATQTQQTLHEKRPVTIPHAEKISATANTTCITPTSSELTPSSSCELCTHCNPQLPHSRATIAEATQTCPTRHRQHNTLAKHKAYTLHCAAHCAALHSGLNLTLASKNTHNSAQQ